MCGDGGGGEEEETTTKKGESEEEKEDDVPKKNRTKRTKFCTDFFWETASLVTRSSSLSDCYRSRVDDRNGTFVVR